MPGNTVIPDDFGIFHEVFEVGSGIVCFEWFVEVILFCLDFGDDGRFKGLSVLLLDHDFGFGVHFFMGLVVLFVFVENDAVLVGRVDHFDIFT